MAIFSFPVYKYLFALGIFERGRRQGQALLNFTQPPNKTDEARLKNSFRFISRLPQQTTPLSLSLCVKWCPSFPLRSIFSSSGCQAALSLPRDCRWGRNQWNNQLIGVVTSTRGNVLKFTLSDAVRFPLQASGGSYANEARGGGRVWEDLESLVLQQVHHQHLNCFKCMFPEKLPSRSYIFVHISC